MIDDYVIWPKPYRNAMYCIDSNIIIRIFNPPVSAKMAKGNFYDAILNTFAIVKVCAIIKTHHMVMTEIKKKYMYTYYTMCLKLYF